MNEKPKGWVSGVNISHSGWIAYPAERSRLVEDQRFEQSEVLLVDHRHRPILVRQPRPVGFRIRE